MKRTIGKWAALSAVGILASMASAQVNNPEVEANDAKATATFANSGGAGMANGDYITGNSISATLTGLDYFRVRTVTAPVGIYRHRMVITTGGTAGHTGTLRGLNQTAGIPGVTDTTIQTTSTATVPARFNQWYGFGKGEEMYYRVTGTASTTADYTSTLETIPVIPVSGPVVPAGPVTFTTVGQGHTTDTDMWLYDSNLNAVVDAGNDDESIAGGGTGALLQSLFTRTLAGGTYYLAVSNYNFCNNLGSPADDDFRTGAVLDFPNGAANTSTTLNTNVTVSIGGTQVPVTRAGAFDIVWIQFTVAALTDPIANGSASPASNLLNDGTASTVLSVAVTPAQVPPSTNIGVTVDASSLGQGTITLLDNGVAPDAAAGDNIYSASLAITAATPASSYSLPFDAADGEGRHATGSISVGVIDAVGACCMGTNCAIDTYINCANSGGSFVGHNRPCNEPGGYADGGSSGAFEDIQFTGTPVTLTDDSNINVFMGMNFTFYGNIYSDIFISSNGHLTFGVGSSTLGNGEIPSAAVPNNAIYPLWDDLNPATAGTVVYQTLGTAGVDLRFIVQYTNVPQFGTAGSSNTFQAVLFENGSIEFRYGVIDTFLAGDVTVGVENADGTEALSLDIANVGATGTTISYIPGGENCTGGGCPWETFGCTADQDGDDDVDSDDIVLFFSNFENGDECGDQDGDEDVDSDDIVIFFGLFEQGGC